MHTWTSQLGCTDFIQSLMMTNCSCLGPQCVICMHGQLNEKDGAFANLKVCSVSIGERPSNFLSGSNKTLKDCFCNPWKHGIGWFLVVAGGLVDQLH